MIVHRAAWVLPVAAPPIRDGWVAVEHGRIVGVGGQAGAPPSSARTHRGGAPFSSADVDQASESYRSPHAHQRGEPPSSAPAGPAEVILPALVNAHTHLELSWMAGRVPPATSMPGWAFDLIRTRRAEGPDPVEPVRAAIARMRQSGTGLVGDVANTSAAWEPLRESGMSAAVFREVLGFRPERAEEVVREAWAGIEALPRCAWLRPAVVPHAPYSVSPALFRAVAAASRDLPVSVHLGESAEEVEFLRSGTGPWRDVLERLGAWDPGWRPPGCGPVAYLEQFGLVSRRLVAVHGVQLTDDELSRLAAAGATLVTCPRSNRWTGAGAPPINRFYASGVRVAIGTDSLAGVEDLNLFSELRAIRALAPHVPASAILESVTRSGAEALGFGTELGSIEPGKQAALIAVKVPAGTRDVEEYLVGGIPPADIRWLQQEL
jgi:cytosine/adenosine deaminase-related metal-dependent hydrolase